MPLFVLFRLQPMLKVIVTYACMSIGVIMGGTIHLRIHYVFQCVPMSYVRVVRIEGRYFDFSASVLLSGGLYLPMDSYF